MEESKSIISPTQKVSSFEEQKNTIVKEEEDEDSDKNSISSELKGLNSKIQALEQNQTS